MDETYVRVCGAWVYLYRAVDKQGLTVDFYLSRNRDVEAAKQFLRKAMKNQRVPSKITLDGYAASHRAVAELQDGGEGSGAILSGREKRQIVALIFRWIRTTRQVQLARFPVPLPSDHPAYRS